MHEKLDWGRGKSHQCCHTIEWASVVDGELFPNMNTKVSSEPIFLLIHEFEKNYPFIKWMKKTDNMLFMHVIT